LKMSLHFLLFLLLIKLFYIIAVIEGVRDRELIAMGTTRGDDFISAFDTSKNKREKNS
jgi:hypothetical protein